MEFVNVWKRELNLNQLEVERCGGVVGEFMADSSRLVLIRRLSDFKLAPLLTFTNDHDHHTLIIRL